ncbi:FUSC family protein [Cupriavidus respiraculi]|uniref:Integral membrane bound transporter domain-containing protein n=1 Tax=Cupriavidus respiraculi TaxID=195930 RepID=A0ABN7ZE77_9BURK|nr:FUSC family protein [Cupriavidus respiraculi]CAG9183633.1 hypothetical protein LMG21510_04910 [Cupriavidus respiraculi]
MSAVARIRSFSLPASAVRRGAVYAVTFLVLAAAGWMTGDGGYYWSATAAIWTCLADTPGTARQRLLALACVGTGGALASILGAALGLQPAVAVAFVLAAGLAAGFCEIRGPVAAMCAKLLYVALIAATLQPALDAGSADRALELGLHFLRGGLVACAMCLAFVPSRRDTRPRGEVVAVFEALQRFTSTLAATDGEARASDCKGDIRSRIEAARLAIAARRGIGDPAGWLHYHYLVSAADAMFALLIVAAELRTRGNAAGLPVRHLERCVADMLEQVRGALNRHAPDLPALSSAVHRELRRLHGPIANAGAPAIYQSALAGLARFRAFDAWCANFRGSRSGVSHWRRRWGEALADHGARDARVLRHAIRLALAGALSLIPAQQLDLHHGYWVAVTVIMVLSPQLQTTRQISMKRFSGSLAGALLASLIGLAHPTPAIALAISAGCLAAAYITRLAGQPGRFAFFLTPAVILFSWVAEPGTDSSHFAALRGVDTALGCAIALICYLVLGQRAEVSRSYRHSMDAVAVNAVYLRAAFATAGLGGPSTPERMEALRVAAGRGSTRAERTLAEAGPELAPALAAHYAALHATLRRMAALAGVVRAEAEAADVPARPTPATIALLDDLQRNLAELAVRPGTEAPAPDRAPALIDLPPRDGFLSEQAGFAQGYAAAAHASVAAVRAITHKAPPRPLGGTA